MRLATYAVQGEVRWGLVADDGIIELSGDFSTSALDALVKLGEEQLRSLTVGRPRTHRLDEVVLLPPLTPGKVLCIGLNYADHRAEMRRERTEHPTVFTRFPDTLVGAGEPLVAPAASTAFDYEGELAVVIGARGRRVHPADALGMVAGYTLVNDGSIRDYQRHSTQFTPGKNFPRTGALGPWLVTPAEIGELGRRVLTTRLNGEVVQQAPLSDMLFDVAELIAYCSEWTELRPGDVIATGTPGGVGSARTPPLWMRPGDVCAVDLPGIGTLSNTVIAEAL